MRRSAEFLLIRLKRLARLFIDGGGLPGLPGLLALRGRRRERHGDRDGAAALYARAIAAADCSGNRNMFKLRQQWQFEHERVLVASGRARVHDPLFAATLAPDPAMAADRARRNRAPGHCDAEIGFRGLRIDGFLDPLRCTSHTVRLLLDGRLLREITVARRPPLPPFFALTLQRSTLAAFPSQSSLRAETSDGQPLLFDGSEGLRIGMPHGDGRVLREGIQVDKKGFLAVSGSSAAIVQQRLLETYRHARTAFRTVLDRPLFVLYGTLLGLHRANDFIPGDDDFDVGYFSSCTTAETVKGEAMELVARLVAAGFTVSFNAYGRLFRLRLAADPPGVHLDVHAVWFERGRTWVHPQARLDCEPGDFLPTSRSSLRGVEVEVPRRPEAFLRAYYGESWRIPDPTYSAAAKKIPQAVLRNLDRACVTPAEYAAMQRRVDQLATGSGKGKLVSMGSHSLYPLDEYERDCDG